MTIIKRAVLYLLYFCCTIVALPIVILASPGIISILAYHWASDGKGNEVIAFGVGILGEIAGISLFLFYLGTNS